ncbi:hypothetical protein FKM82_029737 [Ascaphus truei]
MLQFKCGIPVQAEYNFTGTMYSLYPTIWCIDITHTHIMTPFLHSRHVRCVFSWGNNHCRLIQHYHQSNYMRENSENSLTGSFGTGDLHHKEQKKY